MIVPGGGFSLDGNSWVSCRPLFLLPVEVLSALFRGLFLDKLRTAYQVPSGKWLEFAWRDLQRCEAI